MRVIQNQSLLILGLCWILGFSSGGLAAVKNYTEAKKTASVLWQDHRETFYCGCTYNKHGAINYSSCNFKPKNNRKDRYITWEHVVPVSWYGKQLPCWQGEGCVSKKGKPYKGRKCCRKKDKRFRQMEADLHNLVPEIHDLNLARRNYRFTDKLAQPTQVFAGCELQIDDKSERVVPPKHQKGSIARIHLYMEKKYGIVLSADERKQYLAWNKQYPARAWEKKWNQQVGAIQGDLNEFIQ